MRKYSVKYRPIRDHRTTRCIHCGSWMQLQPENYNQNHEKGSVMSRDLVCPFCGSKQRTIVELRSLKSENLTAFAHLLHEGNPSLRIRECRELCRGITADNPYRLHFGRKTGQIQSYIQAWKALGGTAVACLPRETSRRPVVVLHSYNAKHTTEHARLLYEAIQKSDRSKMTKTEVIWMLHCINDAEQPVTIRFTSDFNHIEAWVAAWRKLGGTAVRSQEHM